MKAFLKNYRQSPRKVRLVANLVKNKPVDRALTILSFLPKRAALPMKKLIESAVANAKQVNGTDKDNLIVQNVRVDKGFVFKRYRARARGRSAPIRKRTSHILVQLTEKESNTQDTKLKESSSKKLQTVS